MQLTNPIFLIEKNLPAFQSQVEERDWSPLKMRLECSSNQTYFSSLEDKELSQYHVRAISDRVGDIYSLPLS